MLNFSPLSSRPISGLSGGSPVPITATIASHENGDILATTVSVIGMHAALHEGGDVLATTVTQRVVTSVVAIEGRDGLVARVNAIGMHAALIEGRDGLIALVHATVIEIFQKSCDPLERVVSLTGPPQENGVNYIAPQERQVTTTRPSESVHDCGTVKIVL